MNAVLAPATVSVELLDDGGNSLITAWSRINTSFDGSVGAPLVLLL